MMSNQSKRKHMNKRNFISIHPQLNCMLMLGILIPVIYIAVDLLGLWNSIQVIMLCLVMAALVSGGFYFCQKDFKSEVWVKYILFMGFVMRIGYMLYTPCTLRSHDLGKLSLQGNGHAAYILNILQGHLPYTNAGQFYHPPLFYALSAAVITVLKPVLKLSTEVEVVNCARIVSCFFSCATLCVVQRLCSQLKVKKLWPLVLTAFLPNFYLMAGRVNNDASVVFFMMVIMLYSLKWAEEQSVKNTVVLALSFGLGMMSKLSAAVFAIPTGAMMFWVLYKNLKQKNSGNTIKSLILFGVISIPLGMAYPIRNLILFRQSFNYVLDLGGGIFASENYTIVQRLLTFPIGKLFNPVYNNPYKDYNIWIYLIKGGLFGEFSFYVKSFMPLVMIMTFFIICLVMAASFAWSICKRDSENTLLIMFSMTLMVSYIFFNIRYPYGCTMDFRYIVPVFIINVLLLGKNMETLPYKKSYKLIHHGITSVTTVFSVLSVWMFCIIS